MRVLRAAAAFFVCATLFTACASPPPPAGSQAEFDAWLAEDASRAAEFARFEALLEGAGVSGVVPNHQLWLIDRLRPECFNSPYHAPPHEVWPDILPALQFIRDHVEPAIGDVEVASSFRDEGFNACVRGASRSKHRLYRALDLVPLNRSISRETLIAELCPLHESEGRSHNIGLGIYSGRRFHIDADGFRGWGADFRRATFPCASQAS